jgi:hypothetical protein
MSRCVIACLESCRKNILRQGLTLVSSFLLIGLFAPAAQGREDVYLTPEQFIAEAAGAPAPKPDTLWLTKDVAAQAARILGHAPSQLRQRYWKSSGKTVWVLEEIGKEEPITAGFVVANGKILQARVLIYRESRGGEIRFPAFLKQYEGVALDTEQQLDRNIDGISGATLSVRAMGRMARLALYFDNLSQEKK